MLHGYVPIPFRDTEAGVRGLHVASDVDARAAGGRAKLVDDVLADLLQRIGAVPTEEAREFRVAHQALQKAVRHRSERVVAADARVSGGTAAGAAIPLAGAV